MSWRPSSIHPRRRSHSHSNASWATSTVGAPVLWSRSNARKRCRPSRSMTDSIVTTSTPIDTISDAGTRRRPQSSCIGDRHETQEQLTGCLLLIEGQSVVQVVRAPAQRSPYSTHRTVGRDREDVALSPIEELGERVLENGQSPRLADHVGQQLGQQCRLQGDTVAGRWFLRRRLQLVGGQRQDVDDIRYQVAPRDPCTRAVDGTSRPAA